MQWRRRTSTSRYTDAVSVWRVLPPASPYRPSSGNHCDSSFAHTYADSNSHSHPDSYSYSYSYPNANSHAHSNTAPRWRMRNQHSLG